MVVHCTFTATFLEGFELHPISFHRFHAELGSNCFPTFRDWAPLKGRCVIPPLGSLDRHASVIVTPLPFVSKGPIFVDNKVGRLRSWHPLIRPGLNWEGCLSLQGKRRFPDPELQRSPEFF